MKVIGITGGVGAGKSEILKYLKEAHHAVIMEADKVGHLLMEPGEACYQEIIEAFGTGILKDDGTIDRGSLGKIVFADAGLLERLNKIIHPRVKEWILTELKREAAVGKTELFVIEAALLLEDHYDVICDEIWYIDTDADMRRKRLKASRGYSDEKIDGIMANQKSPVEFKMACQAVIGNNGSLPDTYKQIDRQLGR